jgi:PAS domain S-box-containing protein
MNPLTGYVINSRQMKATSPPEHFNVLSDLWQRQSYGEASVNYQHFAQSFPMLETILSQSPCVTWIFNVKTNRFEFVSGNAKKILGYPADTWIGKDLSFLNDLIHPEDRRPIWQLFRTIWNFLLALPPQQRKKHQYNGDYRLRKPDGSYVRVLEQNTLLQQDSQGNITHLLVTVSDISHWKKSETLVASVISTEDDTCFCCTSIDEQLRTTAQLSKREREIVKLVSEGYNSKSIADRLSISFHTVNKHRQNIIEKTQTKNAGGLVQFAISNGLI